MKLGVMQPYIFPYIGYFQLMKAVDVFVFYDDVNFIKGGWVNRNRILLNDKDHLFTIACTKASPNKLINEIDFDNTNPANQKISRTIEQAYRKAPYFEQVFPLINSVLSYPTNSLAVLAQESISEVANYLGLKTQFKVSSLHYSESKGMERTDRLIEICNSLGAREYINSAGGKHLYDKGIFGKRNVQLSFIEANEDLNYKQFKQDFVPNLSIIDVLMFNSVEETHTLLQQYHLS